MVEIAFEVESPVPPERVLAAATDFSERRAELWTNLDPKAFRVHAVGDGWADVTEGMTMLGGIWARERYDWSEPGVVRATVQDSNAFGPGSTWELRVEPHGEGSIVSWTTRRRPKGLKGRIVVTMLRIGGRKVLGAYLQGILSKLERQPV